MHILDVRVDEVSRAEALQKAAVFLSGNDQKMIFTPNPEMLVKASADAYFKEVLNRGDLNLCDGRGIQFVSRGKAQRLAGIDFMLELCALAEKKGKSIFLLGSGSDQVVSTTAKKLNEKFPKLVIVGSTKGPFITEETLDTDGASICAQITATKPDILFVAFGMGKQEKWIDQNLHKLPSVKIAMGVGGSFDFISGKIKRAPCWMQAIWLEWLYRLLQEPKRFLRMYNATVKFIYLFIKTRKK